MKTIISEKPCFHFMCLGVSDYLLITAWKSFRVKIKKKSFLKYLVINVVAVQTLILYYPSDLFRDLSL